MRLLLDTHTLLWWYGLETALSNTARDLIIDAENSVYVSAVSAWEIAIKQKLGRLSASMLLENFEELLDQDSFLPLPVSIAHAVRAGALEEHHRDPFDRMLVAQAQHEELTVITNDAAFERYNVQRIW